MHTDTIRFTVAAVASSLTMVLISRCGSASESELIAGAQVSIKKRDEKTAIIQLKSFLQVNPQSAEARNLLGKALLRSGDAQGAVLGNRLDPSIPSR